LTTIEKDKNSPLQQVATQIKKLIEQSGGKLKKRKNKGRTLIYE